MRSSKLLTWKRGALLLVISGVALFAVSSCRSPIPSRDPVGEVFPSVRGTALTGEARELPADLGGEPAVLLVGYVQNAQFDLDRWLVGLMQIQLPVQVYEVPTIKGMFPGMIAGWIDDGMRSGIPEEDWASVITVYEDAEQIVEMTGNERPRNGRVMVLDRDARIVFFHDRGFSAGNLMKLKESVESVTRGTEKP